MSDFVEIERLGARVVADTSDYDRKMAQIPKTGNVATRAMQQHIARNLQASARDWGTLDAALSKSRFFLTPVLYDIRNGFGRLAAYMPGVVRSIGSAFSSMGNSRVLRGLSTGMDYAKGFVYEASKSMLASTGRAVQGMSRLWGGFFNTLQSYGVRFNGMNPFTRMIPGMSTFTRMMGGSAATLGVMGGLLAGFVGVAASVKLATWATGLASELETVQVQFGVLLKDAGKAKALVESIQKLADVTPLESAPLQDGARALLAARVNAEDVVPTLKMLGDLAMGDAHRLGLLSKAFVDVKNKGRLQGQEMRQFAENGVGIVPILAAQKFGEATEGNIAKIMEMAETGKIYFGDVRRALEELVGPGGQFNGMMDTAGKTLVGRWSTLVDTWKRLGREIGERALPVAKGVTEVLIVGGEHAVHIWKRFAVPLGDLIGKYTLLGRLMNWFAGDHEKKMETAAQATARYNKELAEAGFLTQAWHAFYGNPEMEKFFESPLQQHEAYLERIRKQRQEADDRRQEQEIRNNERVKAQQERLAKEQEKRQEALATAYKSVQDKMRESRINSMAAQNGWSDALREDVQQIAKLRELISADDPRLQQLIGMMAREREITEEAKRQEEAQKDMAREMEAVNEQIAKSSLAVRAMQNGWSEEMTRDAEVLDRLMRKFQISAQDPRLQQLARVMEQERALTAMQKEKEKAQKKQEELAKKLEDDATSLKEKYMSPMEKVRKEYDRLIQMKNRGLIDEREFALALRDLKEMERTQNRIKPNLGLSPEQIAAMSRFRIRIQDQGSGVPGPMAIPQMAPTPVPQPGQPATMGVAQNGGGAANNNNAMQGLYARLARMSDDVHQHYLMVRDMRDNPVIENITLGA